MRVHQVVQCSEGHYLNRTSDRFPNFLPWAVFAIVQRKGESDEAFEARTAREARRQGILHVTNLDGTN